MPLYLRKTKNRKAKTAFLHLFLLTFFFSLWSQEEDFDYEHIQSSLVNFSRISANLEYYEFNQLTEALYLVSNGTFELNDFSRVNIELIGTSYWNNGEQSYSLGDFSLTYARNFYSKMLFEEGFQGFTAALKSIFPTGDSENIGLFGHIILEPSLYYSWLLNNEKFFISNQWRMFLPLIDINNNDDPPLFLRFEPRFGYEDDNFWTSLTLDNRIVFNRDSYVLFSRLDFGIKVTEKLGFNAFYTHRLIGNVLFEIYTGIGFYTII